VWEREGGRKRDWEKGVVDSGMRKEAKGDILRACIECTWECIEWTWEEGCEERGGQQRLVVFALRGGGGKKIPREERKGWFPSNRDASQERPCPQYLTSSSTSPPPAQHNHSHQYCPTKGTLWVGAE
jgi:hypothetical protein